VTTTAAVILAAILSLVPAPSATWNETPLEYRTRAELIATAIDETTATHELAMAVVVTFWGESRFSPAIHAGARRGDNGHAICMGQHHRLSRSRAEWLALAGTDLESTKRCSLATAEMLYRARGHCRSLIPRADYPQAFVLYGTGRTCLDRETRWAGIFRDRAAKWRSLTARSWISTELAKLEAES